MRPLSRALCAGCLLLLVSSASSGQAPSAEQVLQRQVAAAAQGDEAAFRAVMKQYDAYKALVASGRVPAADVTVIDNALWAKSQEAWQQVKEIHGAGLERVDNVGSGAFRSEAGGYKPGRSDVDYIPRGPQAEEAA